MQGCFDSVFTGIIKNKAEPVFLGDVSILIGTVDIQIWPHTGRRYYLTGTHTISNSTHTNVSGTDVSVLFLVSSSSGVKSNSGTYVNMYKQNVNFVASS